MTEASRIEKSHFSALEDPRQSWKVVYPLPEILLLVLCATLGGAENFVEIEAWGEDRLDFLRRFLPYRHGIASHDTLGDVMKGLEAELFSACFTTWVEELREAEPDIVAIDDKTSRRTHVRSKGRNPLHLVSASASRRQSACIPPASRRRVRSRHGGYDVGVVSQQGQGD